MRKFRLTATTAVYVMERESAIREIALAPPLGGGEKTMEDCMKVLLQVLVSNNISPGEMRRHTENETAVIYFLKDIFWIGRVY